MAGKNRGEWWRNARAHFPALVSTSSSLADRSDLASALDFIATQLELAQGARVLDLCCGPGRYVVELAQRGFEVTGIDINEHFVSLARELVNREGVSAEILQGDMREIPFGNHFDAVINMGTSFGFFADESDDRRVFREIAKALKPGGVFLLDTGNRDFLLKNFTPTKSVAHDDGTETVAERRFDYLTSRINCTQRQSGAGQTPVEWFHSWRAYTLAEVAAMLSGARLEVASVYGGVAREAYDVDASRMVVVSRKPMG